MGILQCTFLEKHQKKCYERGTAIQPLIIVFYKEQKEKADSIFREYLKLKNIRRR